MSDFLYVERVYMGKNEKGVERILWFFFQYSETERKKFSRLPSKTAPFFYYPSAYLLFI